MIFRLIYQKLKKMAKFGLIYNFWDKFSLPSDDGGQLANLMQIIQVASRPNFGKVKVITAESYSNSQLMRRVEKDIENITSQLFVKQEVNTWFLAGEAKPISIYKCRYYMFLFENTSK